MSGVWVSPGATALTLTPSLAHSIAAALVRAKAGHHLLPWSVSPGDDDHPGSLPDEQANPGLPDATRAASDDGDPAGEPAAHRARARSARNSYTMFAATKDVLSATS